MKKYYFTINYEYLQIVAFKPRLVHVNISLGANCRQTHPVYGKIVLNS